MLHGTQSDYMPEQHLPFTLVSPVLTVASPPSINPFSMLQAIQLIGTPVSTKVYATPQHTAKGYPLSSSVH